MTKTSEGLLAQAEKLLPGTIELRRQIHMHPELGNDLPETKKAVLAALDGLPLEIAHSKSTSGMVATLEGAGPGPTILLRGDMDALPMPENTGLDYASKVDGRMHACGHDTHTAMLAGAARLLADNRDSLRGRVKFMFQPGEEGPGGAEPMIAEGLLDIGGAPDAAFALHIAPNRPASLIACRPNEILAAADTLVLTLTGRGGHGSMPHEANDPVPVACQIVLSIQTLMTRKFGPFDPTVVTVGRIASGTASNVIPETAVMELTIRSYSPEIREKLHADLRRLVDGIAAAHEMSVDFDLDIGYPPTVNDAGFVDFLRQAVIGEFGAAAYEEIPEPIMAAEDFSYVLQRMPGAMAMLGVAPDGIDLAVAPACHSNRMVVNEAAMAMGIATHAAIARDFLK